MDYNTERENNIIKNIAKEIVLECSQNGFEVSQELADYLVIVVNFTCRHNEKARILRRCFKFR